MDQPPAVAFTAFADAWPRAMETEICVAQCATGAGKNFDYAPEHDTELENCLKLPLHFFISL